MKSILIATGGTEKEEFQIKALSDAFRKQGFFVHHFNYSRFHFKYFTVTNWLLNLAFYLKALKVKPDIIFITRGEFLIPEKPGIRKYPGTLTLIKQKLPKAKAVFWTADDPFHIVEPYLMIRNLKEYDYRFIYDSYVVEELNKRGLKTYFTPLVADTRTFHKINNCQKKYDVTFIGSHMPNRESLLKKLNGFDLHIWGPNWDRCKDKELKKHIHNESSKGKKMNLILNQSKITLNIHHPQNIYATNYRTFESLAAGCFCLTEHKKDIENLYEIGKEIITFSDAKDLQDKIKYYLENDTERENITGSGTQHTLQEYTFNKMIEQILGKLYP